MTASSNTSPAADQIIFCAGCNERFTAKSDTKICPRCSAAILPASKRLDETLLIRELGDISHIDGEPTKIGSNDVDHIRGKDLHVYHCESLIGAGGMGRVYLAHHGKLHRKCALKVLCPQLAERDADYVDRFQHEGRAAAQLVHPNVVTTHAIGSADGFHFLEMEFVAGRSLQQLIDDEGRLTPVRATALAARIADGLSAAHRERIIHRDLKPDNVLLTHRGVPKIVDFGLAKRIYRDQAHQQEPLVGTPNYMAPELFGQQNASTSSDVYALGVCYYLMLTGQLPFVGGSLHALQHSVMNDPLPSIRERCPDVSLDMAECVSRLMAKSPDNRPQNGVEAAQLLHAVSGQVRDIDSLLEEAFEDYTDVKWQRKDKGYILDFSFENGRKQQVLVEPSVHAAAERLLIVSSICCRAEPQFYEDALRLNAELPHGALSIREIDKQAMFVMFDTYPRGTVDVEEVRRSVLEVARRADAFEKLLTGQDKY